MKIWGSSYSDVMGRILKGKDGSGRRFDLKETWNFQRWLFVFIGLFVMGAGSSRTSGLQPICSLSSEQTGVPNQHPGLQAQSSVRLRSLTSARLNLGPAPAHACNTVYKEKTKHGTALRHDRNVFLLEGAPKKKSSKGQKENKCWGEVVS